jgi:hypothetical protein
VIALSVDPLDKAKEMVEKTSATFPIGYGLKVPDAADKVGRIGKIDAKLFMRQTSSSIRTRK